jgi:hypothetical protein
MAGGLLNLVSGGSQNAIMYGNPQKTYWTSTYKQITNFGLQNFRLDFEGLRHLQLTTDTTYTFKVKRYADLLMNTYLSINIPDIYSPIYEVSDGVYQPYEFKWIKNLGTMMIRSIKFTIGGSLIQTMSGHDIIALANRDYVGTMKDKWDDMTGNTSDMYDPASMHGGFYPNAEYIDPPNSPPYPQICEPSIRGKQLKIPISIWWGLNSQQAFPLVSLQYNELQIEIVLRPICELFQIRDITNTTGDYNSVISPNMTILQHQFYNFLHSPPAPGLSISTISTWNEDVNLSATYCFLSEDESRVFATQQQSYLIRELHDTWFYQIGITDKVWLQNSTNLVLNWMLLFQRSDVNLRNEWSNFTNWPYDYLPVDIQDSGKQNSSTGQELYVTGNYSPENQKEILVTLGITLDGTVREESRPFSMYKYEQQYLTVNGNGYVTLPGLYCYNFCLKTDPFNLQPSGAINLSKYSKIEFEVVTTTPLLNPMSDYKMICDPLNGPIGVTKGNMYVYSFDLLVIEERYNILKFIGGNAALMNAR